MNPLARRSDIIAENLPEEVILYDKTNNQVHCLTKTAAAIWESCDGTRTVDDLQQILEAKLGGPSDRKVVLLALEELEKADLMESSSSGMVLEVESASRREAVGKLVLAGSALVATILAPTPMAASSGGGFAREKVLTGNTGVTDNLVNTAPTRLPE